MPFPALSQLATPLGDLLPMRFSWLFIGYSAPYQFFSGAMETIAGLLLLIPAHGDRGTVRGDRRVHERRDDQPRATTFR